MKRALIVVDYQYDFVAEDGALTVGQRARDIYRRIEAIAEGYEEKDIFFTLDDHSSSDWEDKIHPETKAFHSHCISGTKGAELYGNIKGCKNTKNHVPKAAYCPLTEFVENWADNYEEITVVGVVTDICVFQTVIGLYTIGVNRGKPLSLIVDSSACASFDEEREKWALKYMAEVLSVKVLQ